MGIDEIDAECNEQYRPTYLVLRVSIFKNSIVESLQEQDSSLELLSKKDRAITSGMQLAR